MGLLATASISRGIDVVKMDSSSCGWLASGGCELVFVCSSQPFGLSPHVLGWGVGPAGGVRVSVVKLFWMIRTAETLSSQR